MNNGIIMKALSGFYYVDIGDEMITCRARGKFRYENRSPLVGDRVEVVMGADHSGTVNQILARTNEFQRPSLANMDQLVLIASGAVPVTDPFLLDRMISLCESKHCEPIICINKWDLVAAEDLFEIYAAAGFHTLKVSAATGEGIAELRRLLLEKTSGITGNSGVGKSSILNALEPRFEIPVDVVSTKLGRGKHTTRHIELFRLSGGGLIADTPGFAAFEIPESREKEEIETGFREFKPYLDQCRFIGCPHCRGKGCAVLDAVAAGQIAKSRHESYVKLYEQAKAHNAWEND